MCGNNTLAEWEYNCIDVLISSGVGELCLFIIDDCENYKGRGLKEKVASIGFSRLGFQVYMKFFCRPRALKRKTISHWIKDVDKIACVVDKKGKYSQYFKESDIDKINSYNLDIIFRFGFNIIRGNILNAAKYGIWSFHHDDEMKYRGAPPCFWEIYNNDYETGAILQRLTNKLDCGIILKKGILKTKRYSYAANIDHVYFESAKWPLWVCQDILNDEMSFKSLPVSRSVAPIFKHPTNFQLIYFWGLLFKNILNALLSKLYMQKWNVAMLPQPIESILYGLKFDNAIFLKFKNRKTFNADCFGVSIENKKYIFFEELDYGTDAKGRIKVCVLDENNKELERLNLRGLPDCHLSYPFIYKEDEKIYMIPETAELKEVAIYESISFPQIWQKKKVLLSGHSYIDATLYKDDEKKYWLFYSVNGNDFDGDLHLHIAYADNLFGPYETHPLNPVKISARSARPAGNLFILNGKLYRPAQNFTKSYGGSVVINLINILSTKDFNETEAYQLHPSKDLYQNGLHTITKLNDNSILVDVKKNKLRF